MRRITFAAIVASAAVAGGGVALALAPGHRRGEAPRAETTVPGAIGGDEPRLGASAVDPTLLELQRRVAKLEAERSVSPPASVSAPPSARDQEAEQEQAMRSARESYAARIAAHQTEARDPKWADATNALFRDDFAKLSQKATWSSIDVDCRMTTCVGTVHWPAYADANREWKMLLHSAYHVNCAREIILPEVSDPQQPLEASILFDCERSRTGQ
jgi:hypothetical protein